MIGRYQQTERLIPSRTETIVNGSCPVDPDRRCSGGARHHLDDTVRIALPDHVDVQQTAGGDHLATNECNILGTLRRLFLEPLGGFKPGSGGLPLDRVMVSRLSGQQEGSVWKRLKYCLGSQINLYPPRGLL